jgi:hypothetical protein
LFLAFFGRGATGQMLASNSPAAEQKSESQSLMLSTLRTQGAEQRELLRNVDRALDDIQRMIADAYFRTALGIADTKRDRLNELGLRRGLALRRARLEVLAATAEVALDQHVQALESMRRALEANPSLILDEQRTPPKVCALLLEARKGHMRRSTP